MGGLTTRTIKIAGGVVGPLTAFLMVLVPSSTAMLSLWISNTATTMMTFPIALAVTNQLANASPMGDQLRKNLGESIMLGTAYAASIGGVGTPIGSTPNVVFFGLYDKLFPAAPAISFSTSLPRRGEQPAGKSQP